MYCPYKTEVMHWFCMSSRLREQGGGGSNPLAPAIKTLRATFPRVALSFCLRSISEPGCPKTDYLGATGIQCSRGPVRGFLSGACPGRSEGLGRYVWGWAEQYLGDCSQRSEWPSKKTLDIPDNIGKIFTKKHLLQKQNHSPWTLPSWFTGPFLKLSTEAVVLAKGVAERSSHMEGLYGGFALGMALWAGPAALAWIWRLISPGKN